MFPFNPTRDKVWTFTTHHRSASPGVMNHVVQWVILTGWDGGAVSFFSYIYIFICRGISTHKPSDRVGGCVGTCCRGDKCGWLISWFIYLSHPFKTQKKHITVDLLRQPVKTFFWAKAMTPRWWYAGPLGLENDHIALRSTDFYLKKNGAEKTKETVPKQYLKGNNTKLATAGKSAIANAVERGENSPRVVLLLSARKCTKSFPWTCFYQCILCFVASRQHRHTLQFPDCNSPNVNLRETQERKVQ